MNIKQVKYKSIAKILIIITASTIIVGCQHQFAIDSVKPLKKDGDKLTSYDFAQVCNGYYLPQAAEYKLNNNNDRIHPIHIFEREEISDKFKNRAFYFPDIPANWSVSGMEIDKTELVACITRIPGEEIGNCNYEENIVTDLYDAAYEIKLIAANTGKEIDKTIITPDKQCPQVTTFIEGENIQDYPALNPQNLKEFLQPYI